MQRRIPFGIVCFLSLVSLAGCGQQEQKPVVVVVNPPNAGPVDNSVPVPNNLANLPAVSRTPQEKYDAALAIAFQSLVEKKPAEALTAFQEAQAAIDTDFVKAEITRLKAREARIAAAEHMAQDIQTVLNAGQAAEA